jgi:hypothetical protein
VEVLLSRSFGEAGVLPSFFFPLLLLLPSFFGSGSGLRSPTVLLALLLSLLLSYVVIVVFVRALTYTAVS